MARTSKRTKDSTPAGGAGGGGGDGSGEDGKAYIGKRISKDFSGEIYNGTVSKYLPKLKLWAIKYDDGDAEEMDWKDLSAAMELHGGAGSSGKKDEKKASASKEEKKASKTKEEKKASASKEEEKASKAKEEKKASAATTTKPAAKKGRRKNDGDAGSSATKKAKPSEPEAAVVAAAPDAAGADESQKPAHAAEGKSKTTMIPTAKPFPFAWSPNGIALIMIDWQKDFCDEGGFGASLGNDVAPLRKAIPAAARVLAAAREAGIPVVHTLESHKADLSDCPPAKLRRCPAIGTVREGKYAKNGRVLVRNEPGNGLVEELEALPGEKVVHKPGKGAFYDTDLDAHLKSLGVSSLVFTGVTTEVCVQTSMREANDRGYNCLLVEDATESYFPDFKKSTVEMIVAQGGIVGWTASSEDVVAAIAAGSE